DFPCCRCGRKVLSLLGRMVCRLGRGAAVSCGRRRTVSFYLLFLKNNRMLVVPLFGTVLRFRRPDSTRQEYPEQDDDCQIIRPVPDGDGRVVCRETMNEYVYECRVGKYEDTPQHPRVRPRPDAGEGADRTGGRGGYLCPHRHGDAGAPHRG